MLSHNSPLARVPIILGMTDQSISDVFLSAAPDVPAAVCACVGLGVGVAVGVALGFGVAVEAGVAVGVAVETGVAIGAAVETGVAVGAAVGTGDTCCVAVGAGLCTIPLLAETACLSCNSTTTATISTAHKSNAGMAIIFHRLPCTIFVASDASAF